MYLNTAVGVEGGFVVDDSRHAAPRLAGLGAASRVGVKIRSTGSDIAGPHVDGSNLGHCNRPGGRACPGTGTIALHRER